MSSRLFTGPITPEQGANKNLVPVVERYLNLIALLTALHDGIACVELREQWRVLEAPPLKRLQEYLSPSLRDEYAAAASYVSQMRVHPWLAEAERPLLPANRQTPWGPATPTQGVVAMWKPLTVYTAQGGVRRAEELITSVDGLLPVFIESVRRLKRRRDKFEMGVLDECATLLGYTQPAGGVDIHLFGDTWQPVIRTGYQSDVAINDWPALMLKPNLPLETVVAPNEVWGPNRMYTYLADVWVSGDSSSMTGANNPARSGPGMALLTRPSATVAGGHHTGVIPLFVTPQDPPIMAGFGILMTPPEALLPFNDAEYFGDYDKQYWEYSIDGVAAALGYDSAEEMVTKLDGLAPRLSHIFTIQGDTWVKKHDTQWLFTSARTRQAWRRRVEVQPTMPSQLLAIDMRSLPHPVQPVSAAVIRTEDKPVPKADMLSFADALALKALSGLGQ